MQRYKLLWNRGKDGYNKIIEYDNSNIWRELKFSQKRYGVQCSSKIVKVGDVRRGLCILSSCFLSPMSVKMHGTVN